MKEDNFNGDVMIEAVHLKKAFFGTEILKDISFKLRKGENLAVLGKSGVGKSVTIKCVVKLIRHDSGTLKVLGRDVADITEDNELNAMRRKVGFLFQGGALYDAMTVEQNMSFPLKRQPEKPSKSEINDRIEEALDNVDLAHTRKKMPSELSGGMKKRIALARTLILRPEIMLYDEPTTGLDPATSKEISHLILEMQEKHDMSSIIITHDMTCAKIASNRMKVIRDGEFKYEGTYEELESTEDEWLHDFFK
jgi:phospholipid/cholesterol/gamma-HCH transport system ATP-binding protein